MTSPAQVQGMHHTVLNTSQSWFLLHPGYLLHPILSLRTVVTTSSEKQTLQVRLMSNLTCQNDQLGKIVAFHLIRFTLALRPVLTQSRWSLIWRLFSSIPLPGTSTFCDTHPSWWFRWKIQHQDKTKTGRQHYFQCLKLGLNSFTSMVFSIKYIYLQTIFLYSYCEHIKAPSFLMSIVAITEGNLLKVMHIFLLHQNFHFL